MAGEPTQMYDTGEHRTLAPDDWVTRWQIGKIGFHKDNVHPLLIRNFDKLSAGKTDLKIFLPLCGKSLDLKWLYEEGHSVVGVDAARQGVEEFFEEQKMEYDVVFNEKLQADCLQTKDGRLKLYAVDLFKFTSEVEGQFDACWDRGSLVAINIEDRTRYMELIRSLLKPVFRMLLDTVDYNPALYLGPPHFVPEYQFCDFYEQKCQFNVERLSYELEFGPAQKSWNLDTMYERIHLISSKE